MSYIRFGEIMEDRNRSNSYVYGDKNGLVNVGEGISLSYETVREFFKTKSDVEFKREIGNKLRLNGEELEEVCCRLFEERDKGEWERPFDFEK